MLKFLKIGILSLFFCTLTFAKSYVLENQNQLVEKTVGFIEILSNEVYEKTGVSLYVVALENLGNKSIQEQEQLFTQNLKSPYVLLFFTHFEKKINIIASPEAEKMFDKKEVYWDYIIPLIPNKDDGLTPQSISAFLLNGFVDIADRIATYHNVELEHSFPKQNKGVQIAVRTLLYVMLFVILLLFVFVYLRRK
ncbi:TPM domain-containing protein [Helicobacter turcicus]|uniref:TPM domain-containing protein n=1 Tax=Helicobacter turcicus TaxID=2867412 RepID=A0ABS7JMV4_9HELI|nr:TPM domain-containing protein [Helicobacter turcicus]MBX7490739.1 TPM domain-containing protein [Helicobacter turcicus]MBX7545652.1 TPM domain-containing protein [Helicobacter turcicus]